jgi:hypothetical protein
MMSQQAAVAEDVGAGVVEVAVGRKLRPKHRWFPRETTMMI